MASNQLPAAEGQTVEKGTEKTRLTVTTSGFYWRAPLLHHGWSSGVAHHVPGFTHGWASHVVGGPSHVWRGATSHLAHVHGRSLVRRRGPHVTPATHECRGLLKTTSTHALLHQSH